MHHHFQVPVRRSGVLVAVVAPLLAMAGHQSAAQEVEAQPLHHLTLANGLEILVAENHAVPIATVLVAVRMGAFTQVPGEQGLAQMLEHVIFRSYGRDPSDFGVEAAKLQVSPRDITRVAMAYMGQLRLAYVGDRRLMEGSW